MRGSNNIELGRLPTSGEGARRADGGIQMQSLLKQREKRLRKEMTKAERKLWNICIPPAALRAPSPDGGRRPNSILLLPKNDDFLIESQLKPSCRYLCKNMVA